MSYRPGDKLREEADQLVSGAIEELNKTKRRCEYLIKRAREDVEKGDCVM